MLDLLRKFYRNHLEKSAEIAHVVIAIVSVISSIYAIKLSINALNISREVLKLERGYKEYSIIPLVRLELKEDLSISVANYGTGPAVVRNIRVRSGDHFIDAHAGGGEHGVFAHSDAIMALYSKSVRECLNIQNPSDVQNSHVDVTSLSLIRPNESQSLIKTNFSESGLIKRFSSQGFLSPSQIKGCYKKIDMQVCYCSISGISCSVAETVGSDNDFDCPERGYEAIGTVFGSRPK